MTIDRTVSTHRLDDRYVLTIVATVDGRRIGKISSIIDRELTVSERELVATGYLAELEVDGTTVVASPTPASHYLADLAAVRGPLSIDHGQGWSLTDAATGRAVRIAEISMGEADRLPSRAADDLRRLAAEVDELDRADLSALPCGDQDAHHDRYVDRCHDLLEAVEAEADRIEAELTAAEEAGQEAPLGAASIAAYLRTYAQDLEIRRGML